MNLLCKIFGRSYDDLWKALIRPKRDIYEQEELGPFKFEINGKCYKRTDFELINNRGFKIMCSFWEPFDEERENKKLPCVIYLHGNSSSRCEAYSEVKYLLPKNICLFSFDFSGCGKSEGEYISLGHYEKEDVNCVIEYLIKSKKVSKIGLWGRSMGAATAIMFASENPKLISAMILDSSFYSLNVLIHELVSSRINIPEFIYEKILRNIKKTVKEKAGFDLDEIEPYLYAKKCNVPAFFCHGKNDNFVFPHHCIDLYNDYKGFYKLKNFVKGNHNSSRPKDFKKKATEFLCDYLKDDELENEDTIINYNYNHNIIFKTNNILINFNDKDDNKYENYYTNLNKIKCKYNSRDKINKIKNDFNNYINRGSTDENNITINRNASQNMRAYSFNKYSKNDLNTLDKKNEMNYIKFNNIKINKNRFEENNDSNSSSSVLEEPSIYSKKPIPKTSIIKKNKIRSLSVHNSNINNPKIKINSSPIINRNINKSLNNNINLNILNNLKTPKTVKFSSQSVDFVNNILKKNNKNINQAQGGKSFTNDFYNQYYNKNNNSNNNTLEFLNNYFTAKNSYYNNLKEKEENKRNDAKINYNFYISKRPQDEEKSYFRKKIQKNEKKPINIKDNQGKIILIDKYNNVNQKEDEKSTIMSCGDTILDENEEIKGRNLPH